MSVFLKRVGGIFLTVIGAAGVVITSPLSFIGGSIGLLTGIIRGSTLFDSGLRGAKIGSLGFIDAIILGIQLAKKTAQEPSEIKAEGKPVTTPATVQIAHLAKDNFRKNLAFFEAGITTTPPENRVSVPNEEKSNDFTRPEQINKFMARVNQRIVEQEEKGEEKKSNAPMLPNEKKIEELIHLNKGKALEADFWDELKQLTNNDIKHFVSRLSFSKTKNNDLTELDCLWGHFPFESQPTLRAQKSIKLAAIFESLSKEQLKASLDSAAFLSIFKQDSYAEAAAMALNRKQLELFASNPARHDVLDLIIKKLKPGTTLLGKLVSIIPYTTKTIRDSLISQITHLPNAASFNIELSKLAEHYINKNKACSSSSPIPRNTYSKQPPAKSKWAPVKADFSPVYKNIVIKKVEWTNEDFDKFLSKLNNTSYFINEEEIKNDLDMMPENRIKMLVQRAESEPYKDLLAHLWQIEAKVTNHKSSIDCKLERLQIILENLSEVQLKDAIKETKFWEIITNSQDNYCTMAAAALSPKQFQTIISNAALDRHSDFATIISQIKTDTAPNKQRCQKIVEAILPHTTPWFVLPLNVQLKNLPVAVSKPLYLQLKQFLTQSLQLDKIKFNYESDLTLNKQAISKLVCESEKVENNSGGSILQGNIKL